MDKVLSTYAFLMQGKGNICKGLNRQVHRCDALLDGPFEDAEIPQCSQYSPCDLCRHCWGPTLTARCKLRSDPAAYFIRRDTSVSGFYCSGAVRYTRSHTADIRSARLSSSRLDEESQEGGGDLQVYGQSSMPGEGRPFTKRGKNAYRKVSAARARVCFPSKFSATTVSRCPFMPLFCQLRTRRRISSSRAPPFWRREL